MSSERNRNLYQRRERRGANGAPASIAVSVCRIASQLRSTSFAVLGNDAVVLSALDTAQSIDDMNVPGFRLHPLKGVNRGRWSVWVNGNWRLTFEFRDGHAYVLDYEDYH